MIRRISGLISEKTTNSIIVDVNGVGYEIFVNPKTLAESAPLNEKVTFYTYLSVRENSLDLFGFLEKNELRFFELLLTINGVGPKSAMTILTTSTVETLTEGIQSGDPNYLAKISGLGKKTAEKVLHGLKDHLGVIENSEQNDAGSTAIDALASLGYSEKDARAVMSKIKNKESAESIIKEALQLLNNK